MDRIVIGHIEQEMTVPTPDMDLDQKLFVQVDQAKCTGCCICMEYCPTAAIYGETGLAHTIVHPEPCLHCGMCLTHCPQGAFHEKFSWLPEVEKRLEDSSQIMIAMPAPSIRYTLGEAFGLPPGRNLQEKMLAAIARLGFDHCWDTEFAADVTIWEEGGEFLHKLKNGMALPLLSSCCPSWVRYMETFQPALVDLCSTVKSPIAINGRLAKTYGAQRYGYDPENMYTVAIMPCLSKKYEALMPALENNGLRDIDAVLTVREFAWLLQKRNIDVNNMPHGIADTLMGESACGTLFGIGGGVMETLARYVHKALCGKELQNQATRRLDRASGIAELSFECCGQTLRMAAVRGADKFAAICEQILKGQSPWHFIEFMACPGGCINGGGQPLLPSLRNTVLLGRGSAQ